MRPGALAAGTMVVLACASATSPEWAVAMGSLEGGAEAIVAPDTVTAGLPFNAEVATYGSSSCTHPDGTQQTMIGQMAIIVLFDSVPGPAFTRPCTRDVVRYPRTVRITFTQAGTGEIVLEAADTTVVRAVTVR